LNGYLQHFTRAITAIGAKMHNMAIIMLIIFPTSARRGNGNKYKR
jgi:hypothetical protein